jgi:hypothetical protein
MFNYRWRTVESCRHPNETTSCFELLRLATGRNRVTLFRRSVPKNALRDAAPISCIHRIWWKLARKHRYAHNVSLLRTPEIPAALCANISLSPLNLQAIIHAVRSHVYDHRTNFTCLVPTDIKQKPKEFFARLSSYYLHSNEILPKQSWIFFKVNHHSSFLDLNESDPKVTSPRQLVSSVLWLTEGH